MDKELYFRKGKRKRPKLNKGDIFVAEIDDDIYIYGQIMNPCIKNKYDSFFNGNVLVVFYNVVTEGISNIFFKESNKKLLMGPIVIPKFAFNNGMLRMINLNIKIPKISYGFYRTKWDFNEKQSIIISKYYNEEYKRRVFKPKYIDEFSVYTEYGLIHYIYKQIDKIPLIVNKDI